MSYKDKYGITPIKKNKIDNFSINWDYDDNPNDKNQRFPVFLFTPDMKDTNTHYHIVLGKNQAKVLRDWLSDYLKDIGEE